MVEINDHDHPLRGSPSPAKMFHPAMYLSEFIGTALLVFVGLSVVIALWSPVSPLHQWPIPITMRRIVTGLLFGSTGATIAFSRIGKISGAHINPAVTVAFWLENKIKAPDAICYLIAQLSGGLLGALALLLWGNVGMADHYGESLPANKMPLSLPLIGEMICGSLLVGLIFIMASHRKSQKFTPLINPPLFAFLNVFESPLSGASANPARSFGPAVVGQLWHGQWIYFIGPCVGGALAVAVLRCGIIGKHRPAEARTAHFQPRPHDWLLNIGWLRTRIAR